MQYRYKKIYIIFFILLILFSTTLSFFLFLFPVYSQDSGGDDGGSGRQRDLEIEYPKVRTPEGNKTITSGISLPEYIRYIYFIAIMVGGLIALGVIIYAGFKYFTSVGNPEIIKDSKEKILGAILGLGLLLISYLILTTINPSLKELRLQPLIPPHLLLKPGVYLCRKDPGLGDYYNAITNYNELVNEVREVLIARNGQSEAEARSEAIRIVRDTLNEQKKEIDSECALILKETPRVTDIDKIFNVSSPEDSFQNAKFLYIVNNLENEDRKIAYGAILYTTADFEIKVEEGEGEGEGGGSEIQLVLGTQSNSSSGSVAEFAEFDIQISPVRAIRPFIMWPRPFEGDRVDLYEGVEFNKADTNKGHQIIIPSGDYCDLEHITLPNLEEGYEPQPPADKTQLPAVRSISIEQEDHLFVIFLQSLISYSTSNGVTLIASDDSDLTNNYPIGKACKKEEKVGDETKVYYQPCAEYILIIYGKVLK